MASSITDIKKSNWSNTNEDSSFLFISNKCKFPIFILQITVTSFFEEDKEQYKNTFSIEKDDNAIIKLNINRPQFIYIYSQESKSIDYDRPIMKIRNCHMLKSGTNIDIY